MNFTDVDDRTIAGSQKAGMPLREYTNQYIDAFLEDAARARARGCRRAAARHRSSQPRRDGRSWCESLEANGHTYQSDGSIYFKISTLPQYGQLARLDHDGLKAGARIDSDNYDKDNARDFVLWKATQAATSRAGIWGSGRAVPAGTSSARRWRCVCSASRRSTSIAAASISIFPHHENEIAQSEGATKKPFSRFWMHVEHLLIDEEKMSKSLGNVFTLPDITAKGYRPSALRYLLLSTHYRKQLKFSWDTLDAGRGVASPAGRFRRAARSRDDGWERTPRSRRRWRRPRRSLREAMEQDLNTAGALGGIFDLVRALNAAIDAGELGTGDVAGGARRLRALRPGARRAVARRQEDRPDVAAGGGNRAPGDGAPGRAASGGTSAKAIGSGSNCSIRESCWRIRRRGTRWKRK